MTKRLLAIMLVLAMVLSVMPVSVVAVEPGTHDNSHVCQDESCKGTGITWKPWTGTEKSGHYYLTGNVELTATVSLASGNDLHLCLGGYSISGKNAVRLFSVPAGAKLSVSDCTTQLDENGKFVSGGSLVNGKHATAGGAGIYANGGTVTLIGIQMSGNTCGVTATDGWAGGAIAVRGTAKLAVKNCLFMQNSAIEGAAITMRQDATATVTDTVFSNNTATGNGGAIFVTAGNSTAGGGAKLTVTNSTFRVNGAVQGGAVYI